MGLFKYNKNKAYSCIFCRREHVFSEKDNKIVLKKIYLSFILMGGSVIPYLLGYLFWGDNSIQALIFHFFSVSLFSYAIIYLGSNLKILPCFKTKQVQFYYFVCVGGPILFAFSTLIKHSALLVSSDLSLVRSIHSFYLLFSIIFCLIFLILIFIIYPLFIKNRPGEF